jgi:hypothetical protein
VIRTEPVWYSLYTVSHNMFYFLMLITYVREVLNQAFSLNTTSKITTIKIIQPHMCLVAPEKGEARDYESME